LVKTITIREEVYRKLLAVKKKDESFSGLLDRLAENKAPLETLSKIRASVDFRKKKEMLPEIYSSGTERR
jgi:predicted CopG family antitoxin